MKLKINRAWKNSVKVNEETVGLSYYRFLDLFFVPTPYLRRIFHRSQSLLELESAFFVKASMRIMIFLLCC